MKLSDKTILITGGTSGIGRALVELLAPVNKAIIVIARNQQKLDELRTLNDNIHTFACSLENQAAIRDTIKEILNQHTDLDIIINNAAIQDTPMLHEMDFDFDSISSEILVNLAAPIWLCALTVQHFLARKEAAYINISSGLAYSPKRSAAVYCATKAGLYNFTTSFGYQLENTNIRVHCAILPLVDTPMTKGREGGKLSAHTAAEQIIRGVERDRSNIYVGKAKWLPVLSRISPQLLKAILKRA